MEQLEVLTPENGASTTESSRNGIQASTGSRIRLVERRVSKFEMQLQKMVSQKDIHHTCDRSSGHFWGRISN